MISGEALLRKDHFCQFGWRATENVYKITQPFTFKNEESNVIFGATVVYSLLFIGFCCREKSTSIRFASLDYGGYPAYLCKEVLLS